MSVVQWIQTGRNITTDNFFTSVPLAEHLLEKGLTIVGTLRQNKPDIPAVLKSSWSSEVHSTEFGFNDSMTKISYVRKKGKALPLLKLSLHSTIFSSRRVVWALTPRNIRCLHHKTCLRLQAS